MIISHQHKFIFIKTRKTAGSSIEKYLTNYLGPDDICTGSEQDGTPRKNTTVTSGHKGYNFFRKKFSSIVNDYFLFAVERNPWDKMVSHYYWAQKNGNWRTREGFDNFIFRHCDKYNDWDKYTNLDGSIIVDKLVKYENLHKEFLALPIPYNNELLHTFVKSDTSREKDYTKMYNEETKNIVANTFRNVIEHFSYTF